MRKGRLRWFDHVQSKANALVRKSELLYVEGMRKGKERPKITLIEII